MSFGSGIRPPWRKLFQKGSRPSVDYSVSPVHEVVDDVIPDPGGGTTEPPVAQPLVTGVTTEYPTSEIIYTVEGDLVVAVTP